VVLWGDRTLTIAPISRKESLSPKEDLLYHLQRGVREGKESPYFILLMTNLPVCKR